jgi:Ras-related protein Rap-1A
VKDSRNVPFVIVGTKLDLADDREVPFEKAKEVSNSLGVPVFEASSLTGEGVQKAFHELARQVVAEKRKEQGELSPKSEDKKKKKKKCNIL